MEKIFNNNNRGLSIRDILYDRLKIQRLEDLALVNRKYTDGELEDKIDQVESDFDFALEKLDFVAELGGRDELIQRKFTEIVLYIDDMDINKGNSLDTILTFGVIISKVPTHIELLEKESAFILASAMKGLPFSEYESHGVIVSNPTLLDSIKSKTDDMDDRRDMIYDMFDYCADCAYENMTQEDYELAIKECIEIVNNYQIATPNKEK